MHHDDQTIFLEEKEDYGNGERLITKSLICEMLILMLIPIPFYDQYIVYNLG